MASSNQNKSNPLRSRNNHRQGSTHRMNSR
jgi:hypothetical protein